MSTLNGSVSGLSSSVSTSQCHAAATSTGVSRILEGVCLRGASRRNGDVGRSHRPPTLLPLIRTSIVASSPLLQFTHSGSSLRRNVFVFPLLPRQPHDLGPEPVAGQTVASRCECSLQPSTFASSVGGLRHWPPVQLSSAAVALLTGRFRCSAARHRQIRPLWHFAHKINKPSNLRLICRSTSRECQYGN
jgi:hypothetical protein